MNIKTTDCKNMAVVVIMGAIIFGFSAFSMFSKDKDYSMSERRALAKLPETSAETLTSGKFMSDFETYTLDQFPLRDIFRTLKALTVSYVFQQMDCNGFYTADGYISRLEYPMNPHMTELAGKKFDSLYKRYVSGSDCKTYLSIIPDKNYLLAKQSGRPAMDYDAFIMDIRSNTQFAEYIDILPLLDRDDYYMTDQHWRQEKIVDIAQRLADGMGVPFTDNFTQKDAGVSFNGTYIGQSALPHAPDSIKYLTNDVLDKCVVTSYDSGVAKPSAMYDLKKANGKDAYEMFLGGADAMIVIDNPTAYTERELVVFRDSFGSSMIPLIAPAYSKITLIDIRYINSGMIGNFVEFKDQDVLFLYSTLVLNSSTSLK